MVQCTLRCALESQRKQLHENRVEIVFVRPDSDRRKRVNWNGWCKSGRPIRFRPDLDPILGEAIPCVFACKIVRFEVAATCAHHRRTEECLRKREMRRVWCKSGRPTRCGTDSEFDGCNCNPHPYNAIQTPYNAIQASYNATQNPYNAIPTSYNAILIAIRPVQCYPEIPAMRLRRSNFAAAPLVIILYYLKGHLQFGMDWRTAAYRIQ